MHEEERSLAVKLCLERNPNAFHPKIGKYLPLQDSKKINVVQ